MKAIIPLSPPGYRQNNLPGSVKELYAYVRNLQEQLDFTLGQLQKGVESCKELYDKEKAECGTDGIWFWEKDPSGIAKCWGIQEDENVNITAALGNAFESTYSFGNIPYPEGLFLEPPVVTVCGYGTSVSCDGVEMYGGTKERCPVWWYLKHQKTDQASAFNAHIQAVGCWK